MALIYRHHVEVDRQHALMARLHAASLDILQGQEHQHPLALFEKLVGDIGVCVQHLGVHEHPPVREVLDILDGLTPFVAHARHGGHHEKGLRVECVCGTQGTGGLTEARARIRQKMRASRCTGCDNFVDHLLLHGAEHYLELLLGSLVGALDGIYLGPVDGSPLEHVDDVVVGAEHVGRRALEDLLGEGIIGLESLVELFSRHILELHLGEHSVEIVVADIVGLVEHEWEGVAQN